MRRPNTYLPAGSMQPIVWEQLRRYRRRELVRELIFESDTRSVMQALLCALQGTHNVFPAVVWPSPDRPDAVRVHDAARAVQGAKSSVLRGVSSAEVGFLLATRAGDFWAVGGVCEQLESVD